ncbi:MAG TPA: DNA/RNA non-specific endonuclease [Candidatus Alistipes avicola]|uniref:DNA/RNA non-specific endonuclease n=1 Tax=Candidatus Alistipes avicola TaxID=2838432 RepID=A0A9D2L4E8_9BACT|nr:DNA/RNA non-specific endonuclease [Candidatus Alistipes avicola]
MKKIFWLMVVLFSGMIVACDSGEEAPSFDWLDAQPSANKAVLTAHISVGDESAISEVGFAYRETDGQFVEVVCGNFEKGIARQTLTGLKAETEYLWFCYAIVGGTRFESTPLQSFTTLKGGGEDPDPTHPRFETPTFDAVGENGVELRCAYSYAGEASIESAGFGYRKSTDQEYSRQEVASVSSPLSLVLENLEPTTKYEFYAYLMIGGESYESEHATLTTTSSGEVVNPEFGALNASGITETTATISGSFTYEGEESITEAGFEYKKNGESQYASRTVTATPGSKSVSLTGLTASTTYTYRMYVVVGQTRYQSSESTFTTSATAAVGVYRTGWAELPIEVTNSDYYYAHHICPDFYVGGQKARNYTVCFSAENHCPLWVAAPRHNCYEGDANRTNAYAKDPNIPSNIQYNSKDTGGGCNKGHMLGSAERTCTSAVNRQVFYYSNIAPQYSSNFNTGGGAWNNLEGFVDGQVCRDTTYIVVGTYFEPFTDAYGKTCTSSRIEFGGRSDVSRPSMFYYAILRTKSGSTGKSVKDCSASELKCAAFVLRHNMDKGHEPQARDMISIEELEALTGFTYFANVPQAPKNTYNPADWGL